jgi:hypothetical protein
MKGRLIFTWGLFVFFGMAFCIPQVSGIKLENMHGADLLRMAGIIFSMLVGGVFIGDGLMRIIVDAVKAAKE